MTSKETLDRQYLESREAAIKAVNDSLKYAPNERADVYFRAASLHLEMARLAASILMGANPNG